MTPASPSPILIGWKEHVGFPEWGIRRVRAKVDTGACTSALDVLSYQLEETSANVVATLRLLLHRRRPEKIKVVRAPVVRWAAVRNSGGALERRPVVQALIRLGPVEKRVCLTVTRRADMRFRILLGREALAGDFIVDVSKMYLLRQ